MIKNNQTMLRRSGDSRVYGLSSNRIGKGSSSALVFRFRVFRVFRIFPCNCLAAGYFPMNFPPRPSAFLRGLFPAGPEGCSSASCGLTLRTVWRNIPARIQPRVKRIMEPIYEGKAKRLYMTDTPNVLRMEYKDDATAGNGAKKAQFENKGKLNKAITLLIYRMLEEKGVKTHLVADVDDINIDVKKVSILPLEVIVRNIAAGSLSKRLGLPEGTKLAHTVLEFCYKDDALGDPMVNEYHIYAMNLATPEEVKTISDYALRVNEILAEFLSHAKIELIDFKLEFGRLPDGTIILADEISPDTCRFWDSETGEKLDKDRFRRDLGNVEGAYKEILHRLLGL